MTQFFENENMINENTCEVFMNDVLEEQCEIRMWNKPQSSNINKPKSKNEKKNNERKYFKSVVIRRTISKSHGIIFLHWVFFCMNDNKDVNVKCL
jgi:hypothetical protein